MTLNLRELDALVLEPRVAALNHNDHFVELYEHDAGLVDSVRTFVSIGISNGEAAVVIATPAHREDIEAGLERTLDLDGARRQGLYTSLDAADTLARFTDGDEVDPIRFADEIGKVLAEAGRAGRKIRVFGEMVALLWEAGNVAGALRLEDHWNELAKTYGFRLFCAYPSRSFVADDTSSLTGVCNRHSHVVVPAR
jgi:hypothetical protein